MVAVISAITTFLLWLLPRHYDAPESFEAALQLHQNHVYMSRLWVNFIHIFFALAAYLATASLLRRRSACLASFGFICFCLWGFVELIGVTISIFAVNAIWRAEFSGATPDVQGHYRVLLLGFDGVWDALFFLLLVGFLFGTTCFGLAALKGRGLERLLGVLFLLAAPLTVAIMVSGYTSIRIFDVLISSAYPILQPISRALLGAWLWKMSDSSSWARTLAKP